jgi:hypothetical protein
MGCPCRHPAPFGLLTDEVAIIIRLRLDADPCHLLGTSGWEASESLK